MKRPTEALSSAIAFMTVIPLRSTPLGASLVFFPVAGALVGVADWIAIRLASSAHDLILTGVVAVGVDAILTRGLHYDAIADTFDGLAGFHPRERRLAIMREPAIGALGALALALVVIARVAAFGGAERLFGGLVLLIALSRSVMAIAVIWLPAASANGLGAWFKGNAPRYAPWVILLETLAIIVAVVLLLGVKAITPIGAGAVAAAFLASLAIYRFGGTTGDVVGATGLVFETVALLAMVAARLHG